MSVLAKVSRRAAMLGAAAGLVLPPAEAVEIVTPSHSRASHSEERSHASTAWPLALVSPPDRAQADDRELIAACDRFIALERAMRADTALISSLEDEKRMDLLHKPMRAEQEALLDTITEQRAVTPAGQRARALAFRAWDSCPNRGEEGYWDDRLLMAIARDVVGGAA